jgi:two-component system chemotaxis sensor kinase CheA
MDDLRAEFIAETRETLESLASQLVQWEQTPDDRDLVDCAFRFVHTVKGSCGFLDLPRLARLSHAAEEVLAHARDGRIGTERGLVSATLAVIDRISALTDALESGDAVHDDDAVLIGVMLAFLPDTASSKASGMAGDGARGSGATIKGISQRHTTRSVRVSLAQLDRLMTGVSDLVLSRNEVSRQLRTLSAPAEVDQAFARLSSTVAEMRDAVGMMRMQNIDRLFSSLPRLLRDACIELDKQIELTVLGSEVEVDREMVEAMRDPLTHILRNAADHGIEPAADRLAMGKNPTGRITVNARQSGNQIMVEISDDGRGIDIDRLGQKAIARGIVSADQWRSMSERSRLETIFVPGLSTAETVTAISGRGVGMDIVRTNIEAIAGSIDLENHPGEGLKITLRLPLTLSIIAGLSLRAGGEIYGITRSSVVEIISCANRNVMLESIGDMPIATVRGQRLAYAKLEDILGVEAKAPQHGSRALVIIRPAVGAQFALDVEAVVDNEELVVKPAAPLIMAAGIYAGTTLPDNGRPMLLLDASGVAAAIGADEDLFDTLPASAAEGEPAAGQGGFSMLMFVTIDGRKQAIRLTAVERMMEIACDSIFEIGGRLCASLDGELIDMAGIDERPQQQHIKVLRISDGDAAILLAVDDVVDIFSFAGAVAPSAQPDILEGIVHIEDEPIELRSIYGLFARHAAARACAHGAALCFIESGNDGSVWEREILAPLLAAAGYRVTFEAADSKAADVVILREGDGSNIAPATDARILRLRDAIQPAADQPGSIYRYDRIGLLSALGTKITGGC